MKSQNRRSKTTILEVRIMATLAGDSVGQEGAWKKPLRGQQHALSCSGAGYVNTYM